MPIDPTSIFAAAQQTTNPPNNGITGTGLLILGATGWAVWQLARGGCKIPHAMRERLDSELWPVYADKCGLSGMERDKHYTRTRTGVSLGVFLPPGKTRFLLQKEAYKIESALSAPPGTLTVEEDPDRSDHCYLTFALCEEAEPATAAPVVGSGPLRLIANPALFEEMTEERGLTGLSVLSHSETTDGLSVSVRLGGTLTLRGLSAKADQLETGLKAPHGSLRVVPAARADRAELRIRLREPLMTSACWPGHPSRDIRIPVALGRDDQGRAVAVNALQRLVVAGTSGSGKSVALRALCAAVAVSGNATLIYIDPKRVEGGLWSKVPGVRVAGTKEEITAAVADIRQALSDRLGAMAARGDAEHEPSPEEPAIVVVVDEGAELKRLGLADAVMQLESVAQMGRAADVWLWWCSQTPTAKSGGLPQGIGTMAEGILGLRVKDPAVSRYVFGEDAADSGWAPHALPQSPGYFLLRDAGHLEPVTCRTDDFRPGDIALHTAGADSSFVWPEPEPVFGVTGNTATPPLPTVPFDALTGPGNGGEPDTVLPETRRSEGVSSATATPDATPGNAGRTNGAEVSIADVLLFADGPVGVREIARQSGQNPGTVSKRLARMERDGQAVRTDAGWVLPTAVREGDQ